MSPLLVTEPTFKESNIKSLLGKHLHITYEHDYYATLYSFLQDYNPLINNFITDNNATTVSINFRTVKSLGSKDVIIVTISI